MKKSYCKAVIGLGFGDEGKGQTTHSLCHHDPEHTLVIRFSGGHQAGHTVTDKNNDYHIFSNFGSGTLRGAATYWSSYCTVDPVGFMREFNLLAESGIEPEIYMARDCPVTTPFDKLANITDWEMIRDGTCGVGVGNTIQREEDMHSLHVGDLEYSEVTEIKVGLIVKYYNVGAPEMQEFWDSIIAMLKIVTIVDDIPSYDHYICEGSQGLMLDQNIGFFPHVTRSNTGSKNILEMFEHVAYYLVTRCYQTRHGPGPRTNTSIPIASFEPNKFETNITNVHQGVFKTSMLDLTLLKYAMMRDVGIRTSKAKTLVVTCCDQMKKRFHYSIEGVEYTAASEAYFRAALKDYLDIQECVFTYSPKGKEIS